MADKKSKTMRRSNTPSPKKTSQSEPKLEIRNYQTLIETASAEQELIKNEYYPIIRISTSQLEGNNINYVKCINKKGQYVYVIIDNGFLTARSKDLQYMETTEAISIPLSVKCGIVECAELGVTGIAFDCKNSLCIVTRDENLDTVEKTFKIFGERQNTFIIPDGEIIPFPIITLSEIKSNPEEILDICDKIVRKIRKQLFDKIDYNLLAITNNNLALFQNMKETCETLKNTMLQMHKTFEELEEYDRIFTDKPPTLEENKNKYKLVKHNLRKMNDSFIEFVKINSKIQEKDRQLTEIAQEIKDFYDFSSKEFSTIGYVKTDA